MIDFIAPFIIVVAFIAGLYGLISWFIDPWVQRVKGGGVMIKGKKYLVVYRAPTQRTARVAVLRYLGKTAHVDQQHQFDARPVGGTQALMSHWIRHVTLVPDSTPIVMPDGNYERVAAKD